MAQAPSPKTEAHPKLIAEVYVPSVPKKPIAVVQATKVYKEVGNTEEIKAYIRQVFGDRAQEAIKIFTCESGLNPMAHNPELASIAKGITKHGSWGVAQLNRAWDERLYDYRFNINEAYKMFQKRGWQPWTCKKVL